MIATAVLMTLLAYLMGSVSSAVIVCRLFALPDPRQHGSGNPGATNVLRLGGKGAAAMVLVSDVLKGTIPVWTSYFLGIEAIWLGVIAIAACLGHIFPIFFHFRGGKGVATAFGAMLPIGLSLAGLQILTWLLLVMLTRLSSLAAILTAGLSPLFTWFIKPAYVIPVAMLSLLIIIRHKDNLRRLWNGTEPKMKFRRSKPQ
ncbi:MAG: glycerol-3-phosphate 1-O-acyltransferase PlsY [Pseudomonadota bacterium]|uniref:glycerol-3-phosphate 1-O-acyltransferase PlsY n=1 Tax=Gallaecimonas pentaromativorans TaxID=584787 RepID=UPI00067EB6AC|nr:glycerol-3-phosphate 1-O-acyltransferase PlsY [Gallaecimonas pentaromativorans]MED5524763.1 glycerol-3-phosphate 1-O-acyltransferase PlsY [Pseudomonadota bacterium]